MFLNGVAQVGGASGASGVNFSVDNQGANIVFASGNPPQSTDTIHIIELPI